MKEAPDYYKIPTFGRAFIEPWHITHVLGHGYCKGAALKYLLRSGRKPGNAEAQEIEKAIHCLQERLREIDIETLELEQKQNDKKEG